MKLTDTEIKFMNIIWDKENIQSSELVKKCNEVFGWKKSTTYTVLKRLQERKALVNDNARVKSLISRNDIQKQESINIINNAFGGSLPNFVVAFLSEQKISKEEFEELKNIVNSYKG